MLTAKYAIICGCCAPASISNCTKRGCMNAAAVRMGIPCQHACCPPPPPHSFSLALIMPAASADFGKKMCRTMAKKFSTHPRRISHCLAISVIISEKQNVLQVASWMLSACCLLHVAHCPLPGGSVDPGLANYAPRAKWWNRWRCTNANALG